MAVDGGERNCGVNELICVRRVSPEALGLLSAISVLMVLMLALFVYLNNKLSTNQERGSAPRRHGGLDELSSATGATAGSVSAHQAEKSCSSNAPAEALGSSSSSDSDEELLGQYLHHPHHPLPLQEGAPLAGRSARGASSLLRSWDCRPVSAAYCPAVTAVYDGYSSEASAHDASYIQRMRRTPPLDELQPPPYRDDDDNGSPRMSCCTPSDLGLGGANTPYDQGGANNNDDAKGGGVSPAGTDSPVLLLYAYGDKCPSDGEDDEEDGDDSGDSGTAVSRQNDMERYLTKAYGEDAPCSDSTAPLSTQGISANGWEALFPKGYEANPLAVKHGGTLDVLLDYHAHEQRLAVTVTSVTDTPTLQRQGNLAWQVHMVLLPGRKQRARTSVQKGACPMFTETFCFSQVDALSVGDSALRFRLYSVRRMKRETLLGEKVFYLSKMHLQGRMSVPVILDPCCPLPAGGSQATLSDASCSDSVVSSFQSLYHNANPELLLGLLYNATTGRLSVEVVKGSHFKHLPTDKPPHGLFCCLKHLIGGQVYIIRDTYVKLTLLNAVGQEMSKCKTSTCRGQPNPTYKETFIFQVALFQLSDVTLMLSVFNKRSLQRKELLGWISLGLNSSGDHELAHWTHMKECKGQQVCRWHGLLES